MSNTPQLENGYIRIANELYQEIYSRDFSGAELRIILFVLYQTYGYKHKTRYLTASYISTGTGIPYNTVEKNLTKLKKNDIFISVNGSLNRTEIGINKDHRKWRVPTKKDGYKKTGGTHQIIRNETTELYGQYNIDFNIDKNKIDFFEKNTKVFKPKSVDEVKLFAMDEGIKTNCEKFFLYNEAKGWKGCKDWKSLFRLWAIDNPTEKPSTTKTDWYVEPYNELKKRGERQG